MKVHKILFLFCPSSMSLRMILLPFLSVIKKQKETGQEKVLPLTGKYAFL